MRWHVETIRTLVGNWGVRLGLSAYLVRQRSQSDKDLKVISIPGLDGPVYLRPRSTDWSVLMHVFIEKQYGIWSRGHQKALFEHYKSIVERGKTPIIVDCGANIGLASVWYATQFPKATILAIELEPENFEVLRKNAAERPNIIPIHAAIFDRETSVRLSNPGEGAWAWEAIEDEHGPIRTVTVPNLVADVADGQLLAVKVDIEGSEAELFRANTQWVADTPLVVVETHDMGFNWRGTAHAVLSALTRMPRDYLQQGENILAFSHAHLKPDAMPA